jgi:hypothetical protein
MSGALTLWNQIRFSGFGSWYNQISGGRSKRHAQFSLPPAYAGLLLTLLLNVGSLRAKSCLCFIIIIIIIIITHYMFRTYF